MSKTAYKPNAYEDFETTGYVQDKHHYFVDINGNKRSDSMIGITTSMFVHPAFLDLTNTQKMLYITAKYQYRNAPDRPCDHNDNDLYKGKDGKQYIYLNLKLATEVFRIYGEKNKATFYKDIKALIAHGFIVPVQRENNQRTIYKLSEEWKHYEPGTEYQEINTNTHRWEWVRCEMV